MKDVEGIQMKLVKEKEAADRLSVAIQTLRNWRFEGRGPAVVRLGRSVRYDVKDLEAFVEERKIRHEH